MKRIISIILVATFLAISLLGCTSAEGPEKAVKEILDFTKEADLNKTTVLLGGKEDFESSFDQDVVKLMKLSNKTLTYKIIDQTITEDKAIVKVKCSYGDIEPILLEAETQGFIRNVKLIDEGVTLADEEWLQIYSEETEKAMETIELKEYSTTIEIYCSMIDDKWVVDNAAQNIELRKLTTGNYWDASKKVQQQIQEMVNSLEKSQNKKQDKNPHTLTG